MFRISSCKEKKVLFLHFQLRNKNVSSLAMGYESTRTGTRRWNVSPCKSRKLPRLLQLESVQTHSRSSNDLQLNGKVVKKSFHAIKISSRQCWSSSFNIFEIFSHHQINNLSTFSTRTIFFVLHLHSLLLSSIFIRSRFNHKHGWRRRRWCLTLPIRRMQCNLGMQAKSEEKKWTKLRHKKITTRRNSKQQSTKRKMKNTQQSVSTAWEYFFVFCWDEFLYLRVRSWMKSCRRAEVSS